MDDKERFEKSIYFRIGYTKRIGRMEGGVFYYKMRKNTLTVRMIKERSINFMDIVRIVLKDRDFIEYYLTDRYNIHKYKDCQVRILSIKPSPDIDPVSSFVVDMCNGTPPVVRHEFDGLYHINDREIKIHIPLLIVYLRTYFSNYVRDICVEHKTYTSFDMDAIFDNTVRRGHMKKHLGLMDALDDSPILTSAFLERFLMACRSEDDEYVGDIPNTILLFPYRKLRDMTNLKAGGIFTKVYDRYKKFINEYHIVYIKNRFEDFDLSKEECLKIITECEGYYPLDKEDTIEDLTKRPIKHEFSDIFDYSKLI